jgi:predicted ester cyclase
MPRGLAAEILRSGRIRDPDTHEEDTMSSSEKNKDAVRDCLTEASRGNFGALDAVVSDDYVLHPEGVRGAQGLADMVEGYRRALAGLTVTVDHQFTEGDYVATRSTIRGRHEGELMGTAPTGREVAFTMLTISRCRDGRIEEEWELADTVSLLQQVGALPALAEA